MTSVWLRTAPSRGRDQITSAAIELADRDGLEAVSLRRIASLVGSTRTSLYGHVANRNELYELMVDAVIGEIQLPERPSGDWRADLSSLAWATRATFGRHSWFTQLAFNPIPGPRALRYGAVAIRSLQGLGLDPATEVNILVALNRYVVGYAQREAAWHRPHAHRQAGRASSPRGEATRTSVHAAASGEQAAVDENFAFGLDCVLDRISARMSNRRRAVVVRPASDMRYPACPQR